MSEREPQPSGERVYWQEDLELATIAIGGEPTAVRMQVHQEAEQYRRREVLFEQRNRRGVRTYLAARFYSWIPEITVTAEFSPAPSAGVSGELMASQHGLRRQTLGAAQAWHYREDNVTVLWECLLQEWARKENPVEDLAYQQLWHAFEQHLAARFQPTRILTPGWEPYHDQELWQQFLVQQGYRPLPRQTYAKDLPTPRGRQRPRRRR